MSPVYLRSRRLKLSSDKTEHIIVSANISMHINSGINSVMLGVENFEFVFYNQLKLNEQINNVKRKIFISLINVSRIANLIDKYSNMKLVHGLVFTIIDLYNAVYYGLPSFILNGLQMLINSAVRIVIGFPRFSRERITLSCIELQILPIKTRTGKKIS